MAGRRPLIAASGVAVAALAAGLYFGWDRTEPRDGSASDEEVLTSAKFADLKGNTVGIGAWKGRVRVINFWATWCGPCRVEMPGFAAIQRRFDANDLVFIGIGIDSAERIAAFGNDLGISYPLLVADAATVDLMRHLGNRSGALPYTIVVNRNGRIVDRHLGVVDEDQLLVMLNALTSSR